MADGRGSFLASKLSSHDLPWGLPLVLTQETECSRTASRLDSQTPQITQEWSLMPGLSIYWGGLCEWFPGCTGQVFPSGACFSGLTIPVQVVRAALILAVLVEAMVLEWKVEAA